MPPVKQISCSLRRSFDCPVTPVRSYADLLREGVFTAIPIRITNLAYVAPSVVRTQAARFSEFEAHDGHEVTSDEAVTAMLSQHVIRATLDDLIALAQHRTHRTFNARFVALGTWITDADGVLHYPYFYSDGDTRELKLEPKPKGWSRSWTLVGVSPLATTVP